ncbi:calcium-binding protein, partial [Microvirga flavescens]|uniref:calcium-binding protein n=1 Tax=Microvirga flavescens TaxID=2249811 RepID=UPI003CCAA61D
MTLPVAYLKASQTAQPTTLEGFAGYPGDAQSRSASVMLSDGTIALTQWNELNLGFGNVQYYTETKYFTADGVWISSLPAVREQVLDSAISARDSSFGIKELIALPGGRNFAYTYNYKNILYLHIAGKNVVLNTNSGYKISVLPDGGFAFVYEYQTDIRALVLDKNGSVVGSEFVVNTNTAGIQSHYDVTALADGRFMVTWATAPDSQFPSFDVHGQIFDSRTSPLLMVSTASSSAMLYGTAYNDNITGGTYDDTLFGGAGNDSLSGSLGNDVLMGEDGVDKLTGGEGHDTLIGGSGGDVLNGSGGSDIASYESSSSGVYASLNAPNLNTGHAKDDSYISIEGLAGSSYDDTLEGGGNSDALYGRDGNDLLIGGGDTDFLHGGAGADTLDGGAGFDYAVYLLSNAPVVAYLNKEDRDGDAWGDVYSDIQGLIGTAYADTLGGDDDANVLNGYHGDDLLIGFGGADTLEGDEGNDTLEGGAGGDSLSGGAGTDTASYINAPQVNIGGVLSGIVVNLSNTAENTGDAQHDSYSSIEGIVGSRFNDTLTGGYSAGGVLDGSDGNDVIVSTSAADTLIGGSGSDTLRGGNGADTLDGGTGFNVAQYVLQGAVKVDLSTGRGFGGEAEGDVLVNIQGVSGGSGNDTIIGSGEANDLKGNVGNDSLDGGAGNDTLDGGFGNDVLIGGAGADTLDGGFGNDFASYVTARERVEVYLDGSATNVGDALNDRYTSIEGLIGSQFNDILVGDLGNNNLQGLDGNDSLIGGLGNDSLYGAIGEDTLRGGIGSDLLDGGNGKDELYGDSGDDFLKGGYGNDVLNGGTNNDYLMGEDGDDALHGDEGDDYLFGADGDDLLKGGFGNDVLEGGAGKDAMDGGEGFDFASYGDWIAADNDTGVKASLLGGGGTGYASGDTYTSIEGLIGSEYRDELIGDNKDNEIQGGYGNDILTGNGGHDTLYGGDDNDLIYGDAGNDVLYGDDGDDTLYGGTGADKLYGGSGNDVLDGGQGSDTLDGGGGDDTYYIRNQVGIPAPTIIDESGIDTAIVFGNYTLSNNSPLENLTLDETAVSPGITLKGNQGKNVLTGNGSANILDGGGGGDTLVGGAGDDIYIIRSLDDVVREEAGAAGGTDTAYILVDGRPEAEWRNILKNVENIIFLAGEATQEGGAGNDTLIGGEGNDTLNGHGGDDLIIGNGGDDLLSGGTGNDVLHGGEGNDTIDGQGGDDVIYGNGGDDLLSGGTGNDVLYGGEGNDTIDGQEGDDVIYGDGGDDLLIGGSGNDVLNGGTGNDQLVGGSGNDIYYIDDVGDVIVETTDESGGIDTAYILFDASKGFTSYDLNDTVGVEFLIIDPNSTIGGSVSGNNLANTIIGSGFDDTLDGGGVTNGGQDSLAGGAGDDTYIVSSNNVIVDETAPGSGGIDTIKLQGSVITTYTIAAGVENLDARAMTTNVEIIGNELDNHIIGGTGADTLVGGHGNDTLIGGLPRGNGPSEFADTLDGGDGNDVYFITHSGDIVIESVDPAGGSNDAAYVCGFKYHLADDVGIELLAAYDEIGHGSWLIGNNYANTLRGSSYDDTLDGGSSVVAHTLQGGAGNDIYFIRNVNDLISGEINADGVNISTNDTAYIHDDVAAALFALHSDWGNDWTRIETYFQSFGIEKIEKWNGSGPGDPEGPTNIAFSDAT